MPLNPYCDDVARSSEPTARGVERAIHDALAALLPSNLGEQPHLTRAVLAARLATAATRLSRAEVMAARDRDGATGARTVDARDRRSRKAVPSARRPDRSNAYQSDPGTRPSLGTNTVHQVAGLTL